jgi:class 3 adenylate cyclase
MVTVVFTDIVGSTNLGERLDPEAFKGVLTEYFVRMRDVIEQHGGLVEKYIGDAILGIFGIPSCTKMMRYAPCGLRRKCARHSAN